MSLLFLNVILAILFHGIDCQLFTLLNEDFNADSGDFVFKNNILGDLGENEVVGVSNGLWQDTDGQDNSGCLDVLLGGTTTTVYGMSAGWEAQFIHLARGNITVSFDYALSTTGNFESDEYNTVFVTVNDDESEVARLTGNARSTDWQTATIAFQSVSSGMLTVAVGSANNKKNSAIEWSQLLIDNVKVTTSSKGAVIAVEKDEPFTYSRNCPEDDGSIDSDQYSMCLALRIDSRDVDIFSQSVRLWTSKITGDVEEVTIPSIFSNPCGSFPDVVDDLFLCGRYSEIDGQGDVLGMAGPLLLRGNGIPVTGEMQFDVADVEDLRAEGLLKDVIEHEMGHVLGIGTVWAIQQLVQGENCVYTGDRANREWERLSGCDGQSVPVELDGGRGTRCGHWDEDCFGDEIMTGFLGERSAKFSRLTVASLEDLGYEVDYSAVEDDFTSADMSPQCVCDNNRRDLRAVKKRRRKPVLSEEGSAAATTWGRKILQQRRNANLGKLAKEYGLEYVGDKFVDVIYREGGHVFFVGVWLDE